MKDLLHMFLNLFIGNISRVEDFLVPGKLNIKKDSLEDEVLIQVAIVVFIK